jgi:hypothetical protein
MNVWVCSPQCNQLVKDCTPAQARQIQAALVDHDHVVVCGILHPGKDPKTC